MNALPTHISRYEIKSRIARGGMGDLYIALDPIAHRLVALKLLNATLDSSELRERFAREARALAAVNHPNIVDIYDTGEFEDSPFIVMELVRGETLAEMIKRRAPLSLSQKLKLIEELCAGLAQAHEAGIIHRDIKPANLMVDQQGRLKILDFGIARVGEGQRTALNLPLTQVNMLIGTPGYMSPEQIEGGEVDHRSDIFAVGAVCYELLAYDAPFAGTNTAQIESRVMRGQPAPLASKVPGLDPEIDEIVLRALKRDPNKRYQDAATFERALERLRLRLGRDAPGPPPRPKPPPMRDQRGTSREARAEAAYQRAVVAYQGGSPEAARRFCVEALAEYPAHAAAGVLLARLEQRTPPIETKGVTLPRDAAPSTSMDTSARGMTPTVITGPRNEEETVASAPPNGSASTIIQPTPIVARAPSLWQWGRQRRQDRRAERNRGSRKRPEPLWTRYRRTALTAALLAIIVLIATTVFFLTLWLQPSGQLLTIMRPVGGTISAPGIKCGTGGADCSTSRPRGDAIELTSDADAGYALVGYTGDCAPGGRTVMSKARTCGATFELFSVPPLTQLLTIAPVPTGGTLDGLDILCGTKGSVCSANHPEGVPVELKAIADEGFTFMGFLGDCVPHGHTQMSGPRTCGATFAPMAVVSAPPVRSGPPKPPPLPVGPKKDDNGSAKPKPPPPTGPPAGPSTSTVPVVLPPNGEKPVVVPPPITPDDFAKDRIKELLKNYCDAHVALDPAAVQRLFPTANLASLQMQLNKSKYRSVQCKFSEPVFDALDASAGSATIHVDVKRVYEHTVKQKPESDETTAVMTLSRSRERSAWLIDTATYTSKPKEK